MAWFRNHPTRWMATALTVGLGTLAVAGFTGCAGDDEEGPRSITSIFSLNDNLPLASDVYNLGPNKTDPVDDFVPEDYLKIQVTSRPHDDALSLDPGKPFGTVRFHTYTLDYADNDLDGDGTPELVDFVDYPMNIVVPIGQIGTGYVLAVPAAWKTENALGPLLFGGAYFTTATITMEGVEETSNEKVTLSGALVIGFSNYADE